MSAQHIVPVYKFILVGAAAGLLSGLLGVGGGVILVPLLALWIGYAQKTSQATSLVAIFFSSIAGAVSYAVGGDVLLIPAAIVAVGGILGTFIGSWLLHRMSESQVRLLFVGIMLIAAVRLIMGSESSVGVEDLTLNAGLIAGFVATGLAMGTLSSLIGIGGGVVVVPMLVFAFGFSSHIAQGTSLLVMIPTAAAGAWRNSRHGYVNWRAGIWIGLTGIIGAIAGSQFALGLPELWLQRGFAVLLVYSAYRLLKQWHASRRRPGPDKTDEPNEN